jgi:nucleoside 2-deoxyribosyltransferase
MSFAKELLPVFLNVIKPGIEGAGYRPFRVDQDEHNRRIDDEIIAGIRRCRFLVADFTLQRPAVYFEAGMAYGLGRNVIWMCTHAEKDKLNFDTRQFNHILYNDLAEARKALTNRIVALEGQGNYAPDSD